LGMNQLFADQSSAVRPEIEGNRIHTKSFMGWGRAVIKNMAEMGTTSCTDNLGAHHT